MDWYSWDKKMTKTAGEIGHGDTLHGQLMHKEMDRLSKDVSKLRALAATGGPDSVLPRWKGEVRQRILLLPAVAIVPRMSMYELRQLSEQIAGIERAMAKYSVERLAEIMGTEDRTNGDQA
jgi:hypothetical protein